MTNVKTQEPIIEKAELVKRRTLSELHKDPKMAERVGEFLEIINTNPPKSWLKKQGKVEYLPIGKIEYLLRTIYQRWEWQVIDFKVIANAICVHGRLRVQDPVTMEWMEMDGLGAVPIQVSSGSSPSDFTAIVHNAIQKNLPAAESYALKDAAGKLGRLFGADMNRDENDSEFVSKYKNHANWVSQGKEVSQ